jgi:hypothetical protein
VLFGFFPKAIEWEGQTPAELVIQRREEWITQLETADRELKRSGWAQQWFEGADEHTRRVAGEANGYLFELLAERSGHGDVDGVRILRDGVFVRDLMFSKLSLYILFGRQELV